MALSVSIGSDGRLTPRGSSIIPPENAGIGDLVYKSGSTVKVVGRGATSAPSGYTLYGAIYGFVSGYAMVCAPADLGSKTWGAYVSGMPYVGAGTVLMRNGSKASYYAQMNTAQNSNYIKGGSSAPLVLSSAYQATSLTADTFDSGASDEIKARYGTWKEYIRQTLRVNGAPGSPFGITTTNVKVHEFGRWMGRVYGASQNTGTALRDCYDYTGALGTDAAGTWWLPSMFELGEMMIDDHLTKLNENGVSGWSDISAGSYRWSSVLVSSGFAWLHHYDGMSFSAGLSGSFAVRPVTLLKLV